MTQESYSYKLTEIRSAAKWLLERTGSANVITFSGEMGAGKTTLIKSICKELGVEDEVSSPTFSLVNEYESTQGPVYHFDFYRIDHESEALDMGCEEYFTSGNLCLIEWPEKIPNLLPENVLMLEILVNDENSRLVSIAD